MGSESGAEEWGRRVEQESGVGEWGRRVGWESGVGEWSRRVEQESGAGEWGRRVEQESGIGEWDRRVGSESGAGEWCWRVGSESGAGEWSRRVGSESGVGISNLLHAVLFLDDIRKSHDELAESSRRVQVVDTTTNQKLPNYGDFQIAVDAVEETDLQFLRIVEVGFSGYARKKFTE